MNTKIETALISVTHGMLRIKKSVNLTSQAQLAYQVQFIFDEGSEWSSMTTKTAIFQRGSLSYAVILDADNCAAFPSEILNITEHGQYFVDVGILGIDSTIRLPSNKVRFKVEPSTQISGVQPAVTETIYQQLVNLINSKPHFTQAQIETIIGAYLDSNEYVTEDDVDDMISEHNTSASAHTALFNTKVNVNQGSANNDKYLKVVSGNVTPQNISHGELTGKNNADQHSIAAITGLQSELNDKYEKPDGGIPKSDLSSSVQGSLGLADTALQEHQSLENYATKAYVDEHGGKIDKIEVNGIEQEIVNKTVDIEVPTQLSELSEDSTHRVVTDSEKTAWGAKYNKPASGIPKTDLAASVQTSLGKADTALQEHQSLAAYSLVSETGNKIDLEIDSSTYELTAKLYDKNNILLSTSTVIDLPLEQLVVSVTFDSTTNELVITLKNGTVTRVPLSSIISGLATQAWVEAKGYLTQHQSLAAYRTSAAQDIIDATKQDNLIAGDNIKIAQDGKTISSPNAPYEYINQIADYLFEVQYPGKGIDYTFANTYFRSKPPQQSAGACTGIVKNGRVLRQLDWTYDRNAEFIVRTTADPEKSIHSSIGVASGIRGLTKDFVESGVYSDKYKILPFIITDGINDAGLYIQSNVVTPLAFELNHGATNECCVTMAVRYILDHCTSFNDVETFFNTWNIYGTSAVGYNYHFLIAQGNQWEVIELTANGHTTVTQGTNTNQMPNGIMTNFRTTGLLFTDGEVEWNSVETYGIGVERFDIATTAFTENKSLEEIRTALFYTKAYSGAESANPWRTEFTDSTAGRTVMDAKESPEKYIQILQQEKQHYEDRSRDEEEGTETWQTVHSCIYDLSKKSFNIVIQENALVSYDFALKDKNPDKQDKLVSGTNIKTVNNQSILGSGNISINSGVWGNITGSLADQTDLSTELSAKATKVSSATSGNLVSLTSSGDITDSGLDANELLLAVDEETTSPVLIQKNELSQNVQNSLSKADTALQASDIVNKQDKEDVNFDTTAKTVVGAINELNNKITNKYTKPASGIPASDLASGVALPTVTAADNGKFLTVQNGVWAATEMQAWQGGSY